MQSVSFVCLILIILLVLSITRIPKRNLHYNETGSADIQGFLHQNPTLKNRCCLLNRSPENRLLVKAHLIKGLININNKINN